MAEQRTPNPQVGGSSPPCPAENPFGVYKLNLGEGIKFLKEVREELKKVTWPSRQLVRTATIAVIVFTLIIAVYLWGLDLLFDRIFEFLYK